MGSVRVMLTRNTAAQLWDMTAGYILAELSRDNQLFFRWSAKPFTPAASPLSMMEIACFYRLVGLFLILHLGEAVNLPAVPLHRLQEHIQRTDPDAPFPIKLLIYHHLVQRFAVTGHI